MLSYESSAFDRTGQDSIGCRLQKLTRVLPFAFLLTASFTCVLCVACCASCVLCCVCYGMCCVLRFVCGLLRAVFPVVCRLVRFACSSCVCRVVCVVH